MIRSYLDFGARHWNHLLFGALLMGLSSFGQTFFVSLYGAQFRQSFGLTDGGLGTAYAIGTLLSALTLGWVGRWIDRTTVHRYTIGVAALLSTACAVTALSPNVVVLGLAFYMLRLGGQGLMTHTALTATARTFPADAGKALGITALGFSAAQAILPIGAVAVMDAIGWRAAWGVNAVVAAAGVAFALLFLPRAADEAAARRRRETPAAAADTTPLWRDRRMWLALPAVLAAPFIATGFFFHQARLAEEKHWDLGWIAIWFVAFAVVQAAMLLVAGPVIDRHGPRRLMPFFLVPQGIAMAVLAISSSPFAAPVYLILTGVSAAVGSTLATALWVDLYGPAQLGRVRSAVEAAVVVASGASPILMGVLIDLGVPLSWQALGCLIYIAVASLLAAGLRGARPATQTPQG
ncbi:MFS transporter [Inquilinus limosus]|uniref:MFS transporter n=1 Tax=Inquilinus limosus TaxID=171674 RepID=UPI003F1471DE